MMRYALLKLQDAFYRAIVRPLIFRTPAQTAHDRLMQFLPAVDQSIALCTLARGIRYALRREQPVITGGVNLPYPMMLAAGLVKGHGFTDEAEALQAVKQGENIIPGWRSIPALIGVVEYGSYTRWPRMGNPGVVMWRNEQHQSLQNRVGLKNPGARAAAAFLCAHWHEMPAIYGINIAVSPGLTTIDEQVHDITESFDIFLNSGLRPTWFTLNISCPNTEDDPGGNQTEALTHALCTAALERLAPTKIPLWVKVSPDLAHEQYHVLMQVFNETGVQAVIATNTIGQPTPSDPTRSAGVGGRQLTPYALCAIAELAHARNQIGASVDLIGCGGIIDRTTYAQFQAYGVYAMQTYSALLYRGPLATATIESE